MILLIDNFDSFTYNIVQAYQQLGQEVCVRRNQAITIEEIVKMAPHMVVIGPGPGNPQGAGISTACVGLAQHGIPVFGICLGHQCIGAFFGASVVRAAQPVHGKVSSIMHAERGVFNGLPQRFQATRYHSLVLTNLPEELETTAWTASQEVMGVRHRSLPIEGVQFHPESAATQEGLRLLHNSLIPSIINKL